MAVPTEQFIELISRPVKKRRPADIDGVISWLRRRAQILHKIKRRDVAEIIKYCQYEKVVRDDIVVQQGEHADSMLIVLRGSVLAYMDTSVSGDEDPMQPSSTTFAGLRRTSTAGRRQRSKLSDRTGLGKYIVRYSTGDHFGDVSLLNADKLRNKTIVAEEDCDLMIIGEKLFDKILKDVLQKEYDEVCHFLHNHPYFTHLSPRLKRMLELSLKKKSFSFNTVLVRQGAPITALLFLLEGQANIYVEPKAYEKEFSKMWPFEASSDLFCQEFEHLRKARKKVILRKYGNPTVLPVKPEHLKVRRNEGYAAAEKMVQERSVCLCAIHGGEVIGDLEFSQNLGTYLSTVVSTVPTTAFVLEVRSLERLMGKRNPLTIQIMKQQAKEKLEIRTSSHSGRDIAFLNYLLFKINEEDGPVMETGKLPDIKTSKYLPGKEIQFQHLLEKFKEGQAQLIQPRVPGALIFKEQMQQKAKIRASVRLHGANIRGKLREVRQTIATRKPRSRREIVKFLKESLESRVREYTRVHRNKLANISTQQEHNNKQVIVSDPDELENIKTISTEAHDVPCQDQTGQDVQGYESKDHTEYDEINNENKLPVMESSNDDTDHTHVTNFVEGHLPSADEFHNSPIEAGGESGALDETIHNTDITEPDCGENDITPTNINPNDMQTTATFSFKNDNQSRDTPTMYNSHSKLPVLSKLVVKNTEVLQATKWEPAKKLINERIRARFNEQLLSHATGYQDFETSDSNLNILENRIRSFFSANNVSGKLSRKYDLCVPKLRRFTVDQEDSGICQPKSGGRVWVQKTPCCYANSTFKVTNHEHVRHHIVRELPEFRNVHKSRIVLHHMLPDTSFTGNTSASQY